jgi:predicted nucleotidyltransferase
MFMLNLICARDSSLSGSETFARGSLKTRAREGDFVETLDGLFFDVKGLLHPPDRIVAYLRYYPDKRGTRSRGRVRYKRVYELSERLSLLERRWPRYLYYDEIQGRELQGVPAGNILSVHKPEQRLMVFLRSRQKDDLEASAVELVKVLARESGLPLARFGISGSILVGLHRPDSDIDVIVYGAEAATRVHATLLSLLEEDECFHKYRTRDLKTLYLRRRLRQAIRFRDFALQEQRKAFQGRFLGHDYFVRCVKNWREITERYGEVRCTPVGRCAISARVQDDEESLLTPCRYLLKRVRVLAGVRSRRPREIVSFRGRFAEQARIGERIVARGRLEGIQSEDSQHFRLVVGESTTDVLRRVE